MVFWWSFRKFRKIKNAERLDLPSFSALTRAGDERIELPPKVLETPIIPFDQSPLRLLYELYMQKEQLSIAEKDFSKNIVTVQPCG